VRTKAGPRLHPILVDHPQRTKIDVLGIEVVGEREGVERLEPAVIGHSALVAAPDFLHRTLLGTIGHTWGRRPRKTSAGDTADLR
jgi:hypothetical protein